MVRTHERLTGSYRVRLIVGYAAIAVLFAISWSWSLYGPITESLVAEQEQALASTASAASVLVAEGVDPAEAARTMGAVENTRITVVAEDGAVLADSAEDVTTMENHRDRPEVAAALSGRRGTAQRVSQTEGSEQLYVAVPARMDGATVAVRASEEVASIAAVVSRARRSGVVLLALALILATAVAAATSRGLATPVERLSAAAKRMASGDLGAEIPTPSGELGVLADALRELRTQIRLRIDDLESEQNTLRSVLDGLRDGVLLVHGDVVVYSNSAADALFRTPQGGWCDRTLADSGLPISLASRIRELIKNDLPTSEETGPDPTGQCLRLTVVPLGPIDGVPRTLVVVADTTERAGLERMRRDFVANASHELKTPVSGIQLLAESAAHAAEDGDERQAIIFATQIAHESVRLRRLVTDLLDLSRLESTPAANTIANVRDVIGNAIIGHQNSAASRELILRVDDSNVADQDVYIAADPTDLAVALDNLIDNAITYTDTGEITVTVAAERADVRITVCDTGVGIPETDLPRIFERFYRVDAARSRDSGGTGLGLALVRHAVERSGGTITVSSIPGEGTTFDLVFRRATY